MNRKETAAKLITELAKLIVGHPDKLQSRYRSFGDGVVLILCSSGIKKPGSDTGRLVGAGGEIVRALNYLGGELGLCRFETRIEEGTENLPVVEEKPWPSGRGRKMMADILGVLFNGSANMDWDEQRATDLVEIEVASGFDSAQLEKLSEKLNLVFNAIGRAHGRVIRVWLAEKAAK